MGCRAGRDDPRGRGRGAGALIPPADAADRDAAIERQLGRMLDRGTQSPEHDEICRQALLLIKDPTYAKLIEHLEKVSRPHMLVNPALPFHGTASEHALYRMGAGALMVYLMTLAAQGDSQ